MNFWNRGRGNDDEDEDQGGEKPGEDEEQGAEGDEDAEGEPEAEADTALTARIQAEAQKLAAEEVGKIRAAAQKRGFDWTGNDFGVTDLNRAAQSFGFSSREQPPPPAAAAEAEDEEPEFDPYDADSVRRHTAYQVRQGTKQLAAENQRLQRIVVEGELSRAMDRAEAAVKQFAPHLEEYLDHPEFSSSLREMLATQAPELWSDRKNLARIAALITVDLDREGIPKRERGRDTEQRRPTPGEQQRQQLERMSPTRGNGGGSDADYTNEERRAVREGLVSDLEEARFLGGNDTSFDAYQKFLAARKPKARR